MKEALVLSRYLPLYRADLSKLTNPFMRDGAKQVAAKNNLCEICKNSFQLILMDMFIIPGGHLGTLVLYFEVEMSALGFQIHEGSH